MLKYRALMLSEPKRCATNAVPHTSATSSKVRSAFRRGVRRELFILAPVFAPSSLAAHQAEIHQRAAQGGSIVVEALQDLVDLFFGIVHARLEGLKHVAQQHQELLLLGGKGFDAPFAVGEISQHLALESITFDVIRKAGQVF